MGRSVSLAVYMLYARFGFAGFPRKESKLPEISVDKLPDGPLIWINLVSVSGAHAILALTRRLLDQNPTFSCVFTSASDATEQALQGMLSERMFLQRLPSPKTAHVDAFLDRWNPEIAVWSETTLLPTHIVQTKRRGIPMAFIDAQMLEQSARRWRLLDGMARSLLRRFDQILTRSDADTRAIQKLGAPTSRTRTGGALDQGAPALKHNETERKSLAKAIAGRAVWLATTTQAGEEEIIIAAHKTARRSHPELLLILSPRAPERGDELAILARAEGCHVSQRTKSQPINGRTDIYIADTIGENGLWHRLSPISFIGGSLTPSGGYTPLEAVALGSAVLHGPHVSNFATSYDRLAKANASIRVDDGHDLARQLDAVLIPERAAQLATAAWGASSQPDTAFETTLDVLESLLPNEAP